MPDSYAPSQYSYPVVCYLSADTDSATHVALTAAFRASYPCIFIQPVVRPNGGPNPGSWADYISDSTESHWVFTWTGTLTPGGQFAVQSVEYVLSHYSTNPKRVYITGESDGAFGTNEIACFNNRLISAALTVSGAGATGDPQWGFTGTPAQGGASGHQVEAPSQAQYAKNLIGVPFWAYHGSNDPTVPAGQDAEWINLIISDGGNANRQHFTIVQGGQHTIWDGVYANLDTGGPWSWLFSQRSGSEPLPTPTPIPTPTPPSPTPTPTPISAPTLTQASGDPLFNGTDDIYHVTMTSASSGVTIHFTLDGSTPSNTSGNGLANGGVLWIHVHNGGSVTLKAVAYKGTQLSSVAGVTLSWVRNPTPTPSPTPTPTPTATPDPTPSPTPVATNIWKTWTNRQPIGQLILAGAGNRGTRIANTPDGPNGWTDWNKWNLPGVDVVHDYSGFASRETAYWQTSINNTKSVKGQGFIVWDLEGEGHGYLTFIGHPTLLSQCAPEMDKIANSLFAMVRSAGLTPGICLRADHIELDANGVIVPQTFQQYYQTQQEAIDDLDKELTYAYTRWGCRIFYVDSNGDGGKYTGKGEPGGILEAAIFQELYRRHPDCLICPEFYFNYGAGGKADSYTPYVAPYRECRQNILDIAGAKAQFPGSFSLENISDAQTYIQNGYAAFINGIKTGNILLVRCWFGSSELNNVNTYEHDAGK